MAGSLNSVQLIGNVGRDPEIRSMSNGDKVANFSIATSESWKDKQGERQEKTEWHAVVVWGKPAEVVEKYLVKGSKVYVRGQLKTRKWEKDGQDRFTTEVVLQGFSSELILLSSKEGAAPARSSTTERTSRAARAAPASRADDDDMPF